MELPEGKVLLVYGQAPSSRRMVIFDPAWLYERGNSEDFSRGFARLSTHVYVKSVSGGSAPGKIGHCAWNRTYGALLVPDPTNELREVLQLVTPDDPRLFNNRQGAAWNFPACRRGEVAVRLRIPGAGLRLTLTDRWFNPCDEYAGELAQCSTVITREMLPDTPFWSDAVLWWNLDVSAVTLSVNGGDASPLELRLPVSPAGFSYLHLQTVSRERDDAGSLVSILIQRAD